MSYNLTLADKSFVEFTKRSTIVITIETITLMFLSLTAIGGNLLVIASFCRNPSLRTITNHIVISQATADFLFQLTAAPLTLIWSAKSRFVIGQQACDFQAITIAAFCAVSVSNLTLLAVNRYFCVCRQQKYKKFFNKGTFLLSTFGIWTVPLAVDILSVKLRSPIFSHATFKPHRITCLLDHASEASNHFQRLGNVTFILFIAIPLTIIVYCYSRVFKKIREHKISIAPSSSQNSIQGTSPQDIKITWTLFAVLIGYLTTWVPVLVIMVLMSVTWYEVPRQGKIVMTYAGVCSNVINPIIYGALNPAFRKEFVKILTWK